MITLHISISSLKECPVRLWHLKNGRFHGNGSVYLSTYHFLCNGGYVLVGDNTVTCKANGSWNGTKPVCLRGIKFSLNTLDGFPRKERSRIKDYKWRIGDGCLRIDHYEIINFFEDKEKLNCILWKLYTCNFPVLMHVSSDLLGSL